MASFSVSGLLSRPFKTRPFDEKKEISRADPPRPVLDLNQKTKSCCRHFKELNYERYPWLAGCPQRNALFCYPCILFSSISNVWTADGYKDLGNFYKACMKHERSVQHIRSVISLKSFGRIRIKNEVSQIIGTEVLRENETVKRNRDILRRFIDVTCHLSKLGLPFRAHEENQSSVSNGHYVETISLVSDYDIFLQQHLSDTSMFRNLSNHIQSDLTDCISRLLKKEIFEEIKDSPLISLEIDETTDVSRKSQLAIILRYIKDSSCVERFFTFIDINAFHGAHDIAACAISTLQDLHCLDKLVAQTHDGAPVFASPSGGVQAVIKERCPQSVFVHCYAHKLNLVLSKRLSSHEESDVFFQCVTSMSTFFKKYTKKSNLLVENCAYAIPPNVATQLASRSNFVHVLHGYLTLVCNIFTDIIENRRKWDPEIVYIAKGYSHDLSDFTFQFLLKFFHHLFTHTGRLFHVFQSEQADTGNFSVVSDEVIAAVIAPIQRLRGKVSEFYQQTIETVGSPTMKSGKDMTLSGFQLMCDEIIDIVLDEVQKRFIENRRVLLFLGLLNPKKFEVFNKSFPDEALSCLEATYQNMFDILKLKNELLILYSTDTFKGMQASDLASFLANSQLVETMPEVYRLSLLCVIIPVYSTGSHRRFSCFKRMKSYLRSSLSNERLSSLSFISIEKDLLSEMKLRPSFYGDVIDIFAEKERGVKLKFIEKIT